MKSPLFLGLVLVFLGALSSAYQGFNYTRQEKVFDVGPIHATAEKREHVCHPSDTWRLGSGRRNFPDTCRGPQKS